MMIIDMSSVKTEALLLFCRDLIASYKNDDEDSVTIHNHINDLNKALNVVLQENEYYITHINVSRIKIIVSFYNMINNTINEHLLNKNRFNPSMLCFSLLATWFKELEHQGDSKEYLYFNLYPYGDIFDICIVNNSDTEYKLLNISMIQIAEDVMITLNNKGLNAI
jgi:hypothetical protein